MIVRAEYEGIQKVYVNTGCKINNVKGNELMSFPLFFRRNENLMLPKLKDALAEKGIELVKATFHRV